MNLTPLTELRECLSKSAVAGIRLIPEDFRLKRAVEQLEPLAALSPVFNKIYGLALAAISTECADRGATMLDVLALLDAVLCTQAAVDAADGEIEPFGPAKGVATAREPYSALAPFIEALTNTGGGRSAQLKKIYGENPDIINDFRVRPTLVNALCDSYAEIADMVKDWLCKCDTAIIPLLKKDFNPSGKKDMSRRVQIIDIVAGADENDFYVGLLNNAKKDIREAAIRALKHDKTNTELLLGLVKAEKGDCRTACLYALSFMDAERTVDYWRSQINKTPGEMVRFLRFNTQGIISDMLADELDTLTDRLIKQEDDIVSDGDFEHLSALLQMTLLKTTPKMLNVYSRLADNMPALLRLIRNAEKAFSYMMFKPRRTSEECLLNQALPLMLLDSMLLSGKEELFSLAAELFEKHGGDFAAPAFAAALITRPGKEVYDTFAPLFTKQGLFDRIDEFTIDLRLSLLGVLGMVHYDEKARRYNMIQFFYADNYEKYANPDDKTVIPLYEPLDERFFRLLTNGALIKYGDIYFTNCARSCSDSGNFEHIVTELIDPDNEACQKYVGAYLYKKSQQTDDNDRYLPYLKKLKWQNYKGLSLQYFCKQRDAEDWNGEQSKSDQTADCSEAAAPRASHFDIKYAMDWIKNLGRKTEEKQ